MYVKKYGIGDKKYRHRTHYCVCCGEELWLRSSEKVVRKKSPEARYYSFHVDGVGEAVGDYLFVHDVLCCFNSKCKACNKNIEIVTQGTLEDTDIIIKKVEDSFRKKGLDITIKKYYLTHNNELTDKYIIMDDFKEIHLNIYLKGVLMGKYISPVLRWTIYDRPYYLNVNKHQLIRFIKKFLNPNNQTYENAEISYIQKTDSWYLVLLKKLPWIIISVVWLGFVFYCYFKLLPIIEKYGF